MPLFEEKTERLTQGTLAGFALVAGAQVAVAAGVLPSTLEVSAQAASIATAVSLSLISAWLFNLVVVVYPEMAKRRRLRRWLSKRYDRFKDDLNRHYHHLIGLSYEQGIIENLRDPLAWSDYFYSRHAPNQSRWHAVHNALYEWGLPEIKSFCLSFEADCELAAMLTGDLNQHRADILSKVRYVTRRANVVEPEYDDIKALLFTLSNVHCPSRLLDGKPGGDAFSDDIASF